MRNIQNLPKFLSFGDIPADFFLNIKSMLLVHSNSSLDKEFIDKNKSAFSKIKIQKINISKMKNTSDIVDLDIKKYNIRFDIIIAVGAGSVIDVSKIIYTKLIYKNWKNALLNNSFPKFNHRKKFAVVSTLPGSGAESSKASVLNSKNDKIIFTSTDFIPQYVFYDLKKIQKNKPKQIILGLVDSIVHGLESENSILKNDFAKIYAKNLIQNGQKLLDQYLVNSESFFNTQNIKNICLMSLHGGIAQSETGSGLCHALAHTFEKEFDYSHTESILLFSFFAFEYRKKVQKNNHINTLNNIFQKIYTKLFDESERHKHHTILGSIDIQKFLDIAKTDICWKIERNKIDESKLFKIINKRVKRNL